ncbi:hypothetical protein NE237_010726 [Protea cynaroides]|uniref:Uncharacterized protein n=1 Tax=Protea cynaroides TaxID=273540 RepID=A0A9Q0L0B1_9MAGN|nr:hypothetical protein NE237_010726 [Protea cynaroides]
MLGLSVASSLSGMVTVTLSNDSTRRTSTVIAECSALQGLPSKALMEFGTLRELEVFNYVDPAVEAATLKFDARVIRGIFFVWNGDGDVVKRFHKTNVNRFLTSSLLALLPLPRYRHFLHSRLRCCHRYSRFWKQSCRRKLPQ